MNNINVLFLKVFKPNNGNIRDKNLNLNIVLAFLFKGISIPLNFFLLSVLYGFLDKEKYGVWMTIMSIANMLVFLDIGIGNGLKNKLSESLAINDHLKSKEYVSTAYGSISLISLLLILIFTIISYFIPWGDFFNARNIDKDELYWGVLYVIIAIILNFIGSLVNAVLQSLQKNSYSGLLVLLNNLILIILILVFGSSYSDLKSLGFIYLVSTVFSGIIMNLVVFLVYKNISPSIRKFKLDRLRSLMSLGFKFFILQLSPIILISSNNFVIAQVLGPKSVADYSLLQRLYLAVWTTAWIFISPLWTTITEAYVKQDYIWIKNRIKKTIILIYPLCLIVLIVLTVFFGEITKIWLNDKIQLTYWLRILMSIFILLNIWNNIFLFFLQGISRLKEILICSVIGSVINIPLAILFTKVLSFGLEGIILANLLSMLPIALVSYILTRRIINQLIKITKSDDLLIK